MIIELVEINDDERVSLHFENETKVKPKFIQYWNYKEGGKPYLFCFKPMPNNNNKKTRKNRFSGNTL